MRPLLFEFKETTVTRAVILMAIVSALSLFLSINLTIFSSKYEDEQGNQININYNLKGMLISLCVCFFSSFIAYFIVRRAFGYGDSLVLK